MYEVMMPRLSDSMEEGKIIAWKVKEGEPVREGQVLAEIESDKAVMELECFHDGVMARIVQGDGAEVKVGEPIAYVAAEGEELEAVASAAAPPPAPVAAPARPAPAAPAPEPAGAAGETAQRIAISPYARKLAEAKGVDYTQVRGTGPHGRIMAEDVERAAAAREVGKAPAVAEPEGVRPPSPAKPAAAAAAETPRAAVEPDMEPLAAALIKRFRLDAGIIVGTGPDGLILVDDIVAVLCAGPPMPPRPAGGEELPPVQVTPEEADVEEAPFRLKTQARHVTAAKHVVPHFYVTASVDVTRLMERRAALKEKLGATVTHLVMLACLKTLAAHPEVNRAYDRDRIIKWRHVNLGLAIQTDQGLTVAVLPKAEGLALPDIVRQTTQLAQRARQGRLSIEERRHATFTISNLGMFDVEEFAAVLNPPASVTLAVASAQPAAVVRDGGVYVGKVMKLTVSCDHRIIDGVTAARFLQNLKALLENPERLLEGALA